MPDSQLTWNKEGQVVTALVVLLAGTSYLPDQIFLSLPPRGLKKHLHVCPNPLLLCPSYEVQ